MTRVAADGDEVTLVVAAASIAALASAAVASAALASATLASAAPGHRDRHPAANPAVGTGAVHRSRHQLSAITNCSPETATG